MDTPLKTYKEKKSRVLLQGSIVFAALVFIIIGEIFSKQRDSVYISNFIWLIAVFFVLFFLIIYFIPVGRLELYKDRFTYKRGGFSLTSLWSEVNTITFQINGGKYGNVGRSPTAFVIRTASGTTKLIDTKILKSLESNQYVNLVNFVKELESISGKEIKWGEASTGKYSEASFVNYLKGEGIIK